MDGLIAIIVIIAIVNALTSGKKKKAEQAKQKGGAQRAAQAKPQPKPKPAPRQVRIPYSKEEWNAYLSEINGGAPKKASPKPAPMPKLVPEIQEVFEGSISTQGESDEEHAEHRRRIAEEEAMRRQERDALADLREANLDRLRAAVVMSEVLGKPVSLRPRTGYHR